MVRPANRSDMLAAGEVEALAIQSLRQVYRPTPRLREAAAKSNATLPRLVATLDDQVVGTVRFRQHEGRLHLIGLIVHPAHQRRGVGRALVEATAAIARDAGLSRLSLTTIEQTGNVLIFERMGFIAIRREPAQDLESVTGEPLVECYMERALAGDGQEGDGPA